MWLKLLNFLISHPSSDLCIGSTLMNAFNINSCHSPTKFLQPANLTTYTILSLFNLHCRTSSSSVVTLARHPYLPHYKSPTALSHMHHLTCGISSILHSTNRILFTLLLGSWFTSSCIYHLILVVTTFTLITYHSLGLSLQT